MGSDEGGGLDEATAFFDFVTTNFSMTSSHWVMYNTESEFTDIIGESGYSRNPTDERPAFSAGIMFTAGSPDWAYTVSEGWGERNNFRRGCVLPVLFHFCSSYRYWATFACICLKERTGQQRPQRCCLFVSLKGSHDSAISMYDVFAASPPQRFVDLRSRSDQCLGELFLISAG